MAFLFLKSITGNYNYFNEHKSEDSVSIDKNQNAYIDDLSTLFCGVQNEVVNVTITSCLTTDFKTYTINFSSIHFGIEKLLFSTYSQYISTSIEFIGKFRKCDIIFPFHYFW